MGKKRKHEKRKREWVERLANGIVMPKGAIAADLTQQAPHNSYSPRLYYVEYEFTCVDCGSEEVWTAERQKSYYEVAKGPIQAVAIRCRRCRTARREMQERSRSGPRQNPS